MLVAMINPATFRENIFTNRVHESAEAGWILHGTRLDTHPDTAESLLAHILDSRGVNPASAQSNSQALAEIGDKMGFGGRVVRPEAAEIFFIKGVKVHWRSFEPVYFSLCC